MALCFQLNLICLQRINKKKCKSFLFKVSLKDKFSLKITMQMAGIQWRCILTVLTQFNSGCEVWPMDTKEQIQYRSRPSAL